MNPADLAALAIIALFGYLGYRRGLLDMLATLAGMVLGVGAAFFGRAPLAAAWPLLPTAASSGAAWFLILFAGVHLLVVALLSRWLRPVPFSGTAWNRWLGVLPGMVEGTVLAGMLALVLLLVPQSKVAADPIVEGRLTSSLLEMSSKVQVALHEEFGNGIREMVGLGAPVGVPEKTYPLAQAQNVQVEVAEESQSLLLLNAARVEAGLPPLKVDRDLTALARAHSTDMWRRGYFGHRDPEGRDVGHRLDASRLPYLVVGENLALAPSATVAHRGLMESPGHRSNILNPRFAEVGLGAVRGPAGLTITQIFRN